MFSLSVGTFGLNIQVPMSLLNHPPGGYLNIFTDFIFTQYGQVFRWEFYEVQPGVVYIDVWRSLPNDDVKLVAKRRIVAAKTGHMVSL